MPHSEKLIAAGHIGFLGRAGVFLFVGVLFFRLIADPSINNSNETTIGNGLAQLQTNRGGRACLFILGFFLIVYGTFAVSTHKTIMMSLLLLSICIVFISLTVVAGCKYGLMLLLAISPNGLME